MKMIVSRGKIERDLKKFKKFWEERDRDKPTKLRSKVYSQIYSLTRSLRGYERKLKNERWKKLFDEANYYKDLTLKYCKEGMANES